ncbi:MAG: sigma-70 family RNA polymerase sigma factor [Candidatus Nitronauta litoralis]|uniref:Sigma-70 family RNA polymerase sigma factor n=1 Tax=Candidatus Nitronauta litoralis TaxID=2705533 RepID=A0A7T0BX68_9BACT|nr:MAG: sigma-70 family RNA polymerase sigma factor [Candidatus Nitronauta litoralis]
MSENADLVCNSGYFKIQSSCWYLLEKFATNIGEGSSEEARKHLLPHLDLIFRCAYRMTGRRQDAEDLSQETYYFAFKNFEQLKDQAKAKSWLFSILRNLFLKEIEKTKKKTFLEFDSISSALGGKTNIEQEFLDNETANSIREVLETLEPRLKLPIKMFYFEKKSYKEIASTMDLPMGTVMSRIARAKVNLKRKLSRNGKLNI